jgi:WD40 repeat protein
LAIVSNDFQFDVFLSHSSKDKAVVRELAARLKKDGVRVWLDEEQIKPGDSIPAKIEEGLEHSRVLVLCMSANAFGSDWAQLEAGTFRFRDPLNKERRFIPLRLDDTPIKGSLAQFLYINWLPADREQEYAKLLEACGESKISNAPDGNVPFKNESSRVDCYGPVMAFAFNSSLTMALTATWDNFLRLWSVTTGKCLKVLKSHRKPVTKIEWSSDELRILVWGPKQMVRLIDLQNDKIISDF